MLITDKDEQGDRALAEAKKIIKGCRRKKLPLKLKLAAVALFVLTTALVSLRFI